MLKLKVKHVKTERLKTQTNVTFSSKDNIDDLDIIQLSKAHGFLIFSPDELKKEIEEAARNIKTGADISGLSPSKRLRGALYNYWYKVKQKEWPSWEDFYVSSINTIISKITDKVLKFEDQ